MVSFEQSTSAVVLTSFFFFFCLHAYSLLRANYIVKDNNNVSEAVDWTRLETRLANC